MDSQDIEDFQGAIKLTKELAGAAKDVRDRASLAFIAAVLQRMFVRLKRASEASEAS